MTLLLTPCIFFFYTPPSILIHTILQHSGNIANTRNYLTTHEITRKPKNVSTDFQTYSIFPSLHAIFYPFNHYTLHTLHITITTIRTSITTLHTHIDTIYILLNIINCTYYVPNTHKTALATTVHTKVTKLYTTINTLQTKHHKLHFITLQTHKTTYTLQ
jgi:hypothetical protein